MKKALILITLLTSSLAYSQEKNCFQTLEEAFQKRGSYTIGDDVHNNVIISFIKADRVECYEGKVRVENGVITTLWIKFEDNTLEFYDKKIYNARKMAPTITNGISELIISDNGDKMRVVFIEKLKPKPKAYKQMTLPDDL